MNAYDLVHIYIPPTPVAPYGAVYRYYPGGMIDCLIIFVER